MYSYYTIHNAVEQVLYKDKASKFYGFAYPVKNEIEIKEKLEFVKAQHPKATHHCYAYRIGIDKNNYRANDDGEPSGTAGKPILGQ
ncbi:MAG TPA: YigZ family protein, partial [Chitinophagales bacterium]|nr:YigZ family protein [Chitinophagales bacterium]